MVELRESRIQQNQFNSQGISSEQYLKYQMKKKVQSLGIKRREKLLMEYYLIDSKNEKAAEDKIN